MSPEEHKLLQRSVALSEENNDMLRKMQRSMRLGRVLTVIYWLIIIGIALGAYVFVQPYVSKIVAEYGSLTGIVNKFK